MRKHREGVSSMFLVPRNIYFSIRKNLSDGDKLEKLNQLNTGSNYIENAIQYNKHKSYKSPMVNDTVTTFNKTINSSINSNGDSALTNEGGLRQHFGTQQTTSFDGHGDNFISHRVGKWTESTCTDWWGNERAISTATATAAAAPAAASGNFAKWAWSTAYNRCKPIFISGLIDIWILSGHI